MERERGRDEAMASRLVCAQELKSEEVSPTNDGRISDDGGLEARSCRRDVIPTLGDAFGQLQEKLFLAQLMHTGRSSSHFLRRRRPIIIQLPISFVIERLRTSQASCISL